MFSQQNLIFIVSPPRSGSTLLQRVLASHSAIHTHPEPHLITPLYYLGYYATVDKAPYDHINSASALREFCQELPRGEEDYLDALRAYALTLYERVLKTSGKEYFLDKTPAYSLILPFLTRLFPKAKYVVLTRHPLAIMHSVAHSFFAGDYAQSQAINPIIDQYVPAIGEFLRTTQVPHVRIRYEDLVQDPETQTKSMCQYLGIPFESSMIEYGTHKHISKSYGDPMSVQKHSRPVATSLNTWASDLAARPEALDIAVRSVATLDPQDVTAWGFQKETLLDEIQKTTKRKTATPRNMYRLKRQVLLKLRQNIHHNALGEVLGRIRYYCDVLLRP